MSQWTNKTSGVAARNGTTSHTVTFPASAAGSLLVVVVGMAATTTISGFAKSVSAVNATECAVFTRTGSSLSSVTMTHGGTNFPCSYVVYEFPPGSTFASGTSTSNVAHTTVGPTLSGLSGTNTIFAAESTLVSSGDATIASTWVTPSTEDIDSFTAFATTGGAYLTVGYTDASPVSAYAMAVTDTSGANRTQERVVFAINVPGVTPRLTPTASYPVYDTASDKVSLASPSFTPLDGELLLVKCTAAATGMTMSTPTNTGGTLAWSLITSSITTNHCPVYVYAAQVGVSPGAIVITVAVAGTSLPHSMVVERWPNAQLATTPATNSTKIGTGAPSVSLTTVANNSVVSWMNGDWAAVNGSSRAYITSSATPTEDGYTFTSGQYTVESAYQQATTAGAQTFGLTAPTGETWAIVGIEIQLAENTPKFVQSPAGVSSGSSSAASTPIAFTNPNTATNLLIAYLTWDSSGSITQVAVTDSLGNTWQQVPNAFFNDTSGNQAIAIWYADNCLAGANTVTAKYGPSGTTSRQFRGMIIEEWSNAAASPVDGGHAQFGSATTTANSASSGSFTTTLDGDLVVGVIERYTNSISIAAGTGFTKRIGTTGDEFVAESRMQAAHGSVAATYTPSAATDYVMAGAAFSPLTTASATPITATAALSLSATGNANTPVTGTASLSLSASGTVLPNTGDALFVDGVSANDSLATAGTSISTVIPTTIPVGSCMLACRAVAQSQLASIDATHFTPAGWTEIGRASGSTLNAMILLYKVATSGDLGSTVNWTLPSAYHQSVGISGYYGSDPINPIDNFAFLADSTTETNHSLPTTTVVANNSVPVFFVTERASTTASTWTPPTGSTTRVTTQATASTQNSSLCIADRGDAPLVSGVSTPSGHYTGTASTGNVITAVVTLAPIATPAAITGSASLSLSATGTAGATAPPSLVTVKAATSSFVNTGGATQTITYPGTPAVGDPIGIWITGNDSTMTLPSGPTGWMVEYATSVGTGFRMFMHKLYDDGSVAQNDGTSVSVTFSKQPVISIVPVVFDHTVHAGFGTIGTVTTRATSSISSSALATGSSAAPNLVVFHEKTTSQTSCTVTGVTAIENVLPPTGIAGSVYVGWYDDTGGTANQTATYALTGNVNGCGYQIPLVPATSGPTPGTGAASISLLASGATQVAATASASLTLSAGSSSPVQLWMQQARWYVAHRGGSVDWPEETLYAYAHAAAWNSQLALEVSVWQSSDGVWVCSHDQTTGRVFGTNLDIPTSTWSALSGLTTTSGGQPIARLDDVLNTYAVGNRVLMIDDKGQQSVTAFLDFLDSYGGKARFISKGFCTSTTVADAATARGYQTWGYYYDADVATNLPATAAHWSILGMDYTATSTDWTTILGYGKPVLGHIIPDAAGAATAFGFGAKGIVASGVMEAVPNDTPTATASLTLAASGTAKAVAAGTAALSLGANGSASSHAAVSATAALSLVASGNEAAPAAGIASVALSAAGTAAALVTGAASLTLAATGSAISHAAVIGTAALALSASGAAAAPITGGASLTLAATGGAGAGAAGSAALALLAAGSVISHAAITATGSVSLLASGSTGVPVTGSASILLAAAATSRAGAAGTAALGLLAAGTGIAALSGAATIDLLATGSVARPLPQPDAAYNFDAGSGTTVLDQTGHGYTGTFIDPAGDGVGLKWFSPGVNGSPSMAYCDDTTTVGGTYIQVARDPSLEPTDHFTIMAWTEVTDGLRGDTYRVLITKPVNGANDSIALYPAGGDSGYPFATITTTDGIFTTPRPDDQTPTSELVHMAMRYDGVNLDLLINGNVVASTPATGTIVYDDTTPWCMLGSSSFGNEWLPGDIDDARFFVNDVLTDAEIQSLMPIPVPGLVTGAAGTASLELAAAGTVAASVAGSASISLVASGSAVSHAGTTGTAALILAASGSVRSVVASAASISLVAIGNPSSVAGGSASLSLLAAGQGIAAPGGAASLDLEATSSAVALSVGFGSIELLAGWTTAGSVSLFTGLTPTQDDEADNAQYTLGTTFYSDIDGVITGVIYRKGPSHGGWDFATIAVGIYDMTGLLLASGSRVQSDTDPDGPVIVLLDDPLPITANTNYVAVYVTPHNSGYVDTAPFFGSAYDNPPLHALADTGIGDAKNGRFNVGSTMAFPTASFNHTNYFVDVVFFPSTSNMSVTGGASLDLAALGTTQVPVAGSASLSLSAAGSVQTPEAGAASLTLTATGSTQATPAGVASIELVAAGTLATHTVASGSISLLAAVTAHPVFPGASASLVLMAAGAAVPHVAGSASMVLLLTGTLLPPAIIGAASLLLTATGTAAPTDQHGGAAALTLTASGSLRTGATGTAALALFAGATVGGQLGGSASFDLLAVGAVSTDLLATGSLDLLAVGEGTTSLVATAVLLLAAFGTMAETRTGPQLLGVWDGATMHPAVLLGVWNGATINPANILEVKS